jgi:uncharacterized membrane protein YphA (DoxX/SURF4 family)
VIRRLVRLGRGDHDLAVAPYALAGLRIFAGVLWLVNLSWKLPPDFGRDDPEGLLYNFELAADHAVFGFLQDLARDAFIPHFTLFGWLVFVAELLAGVLLLLGLLTRLGALIGAIQAVIITLLVVQAPSEWFWTYAMLIVIHLVLLVAPSGQRLSIDRWLRG